MWMWEFEGSVHPGIVLTLETVPQSDKYLFKGNPLSDLYRSNTLWYHPLSVLLNFQWIHATSLAFTPSSAIVLHFFIYLHIYNLFVLLPNLVKRTVHQGVCGKNKFYTHRMQYKSYLCFDRSQSRYIQWDSPSSIHRFSGVSLIEYTGTWGGMHRIMLGGCWGLQPKEVLWIM